MRKRKTLKDLTVKDNFMFAAVMMDEEIAREVLELTVNYSVIELPEHLICTNFVCVDSGCVHNTFTAT